MGDGAVLRAIVHSVRAAARAASAVHGTAAAASLGSSMHRAVHARAAWAAAARVRTAARANHDNVLWAAVWAAHVARAAKAAGTATRARALWAARERWHLLVHASRAAVRTLRAAALLRARAVCVGRGAEELGRVLDGIWGEHAGHGHCRRTRAARDGWNTLLLC